MARKGKLIAIEGIDQAGKATQAKLLAKTLESQGQKTHVINFPAYDTPIGQEIKAFLQGGKEIAPHVRYLLFAANRYEFKEEIEAQLDRGTILLADRYSASGIAYGMAHGLPRSWLEALEAELPSPDLVIFLDLKPEIAAARKKVLRDRYEQNLALLNAVNRAYKTLAASSSSWCEVAAEHDPEKIASQIETIVLSRLF